MSAIDIFTKIIPAAVSLGQAIYERVKDADAAVLELKKLEDHWRTWPDELASSQAVIDAHKFRGDP